MDSPGRAMSKRPRCSPSTLQISQLVVSLKQWQRGGLTPGEIKETICRILAEDIADFHPSTAPDGGTLVIYILSTVPRRTLPKSFPHCSSALYECNHICWELSEGEKHLLPKSFHRIALPLPEGLALPRLKDFYSLLLHFSCRMKRTHALHQYAETI